MNDPLYLLFERHLMTALVEDETTDELLTRVVSAYMSRLLSEGNVPASMRGALEEDLRAEVLEMIRKKTYGHFNLASYRKAAGVDVVVSAPLDLRSSPSESAFATAQKEKARRGGRA